MGNDQGALGPVHSQGCEHQSGVTRRSLHKSWARHGRMRDPDSGGRLRISANVTARFGDRDRRDAGGRAQRIEFTVLEKLSGLHGGP